MTKEEKRKRVRLIKKFKHGEKVIYEGTNRKALRKIPPSKKDQYYLEEIN